MNDSAFDAKNKVLNCDGKTVTLSSQDIVGAAVCNGKHVQYAAADSHGQLMLLTNDLANYQDAHDISSLNDWKGVKVSSAFPSSMSANFAVTGAISMVACDDSNFVFWRDQGGHFWALRCAPDGKSKPEVVSINLANTTLATSTPTSNMAAIKLPKTGNANLDGKIGVVALVSGPLSYVAAVVLDPTTFNKNQPWAAADYTGGLWCKFDQDPSIAATYTTLSASWLNQGILQLSGDAKPQPYFYLIILCHAPGRSNSFKSYGSPLLQTFDTLSDGRGDRAPSTPITWSAGNSAALGATLRVAPDGTMIAGFVDTSSHLRAASLNPNGTASSDPNHGKPGLYSPSWVARTTDLDGHSPSMLAYNPTCSVYIPLPTTRGPSPFPIQVPNGGGATQTYSDCVLQKYVEFDIGSNSAHNPLLSTFYWGEVFSVPNYITSTVVDQYKNTQLLSMVADTFPYPVPKKQVWGPDSPSGMINWLLCTYEYLVGDDTDVTVETTLSGSAGFKFSETLLVTTLGVQTEDSLSAGYASVTRNSNATHTATSCAVTTRGLPLELSGGGASADQASLQISQQGTLFGVAPVKQIGIDLCTTALRGQTSFGGSIAWNVHPILTAPPSALSGEFRTYCYTPGNLLTYSESAINQKMQTLFNGLTSQQQQMFVINGQDYRSLYNGNYLTNVVNRFGMNTFGPGRNASYLEFSFSETGVQRNEFQATTNFTDTGGWFVNGSFYAGLASHIEENGELGFLGIISFGVPMAEEETSFMVGVDFSGSMNTTQSDTKTWGIKLGEYLNPLAPGEAYTVRMYFLKPSPLWAMEVKQFGLPTSDYPPPGPAIDLINSSPVRVLFTVSYVSDALANRLRAS